MFNLNLNQNNQLKKKSDYHLGHNTNVLFKLKNATVEFGRFKALNSIEVEILNGEIIFVTGVSGSGKTTFLNVLSGQLFLSSGDFILNRVRGEKLVIGSIFQDLKIFENLTCLENLFFSFDPKIYKNKKIFLQEVNRLTRYFEMEEKLPALMKQANGGLKQKVAIVRALLKRPNILICDEPTSALDKDNSYKLYEMFSYLNEKEKVTIIWASHNKELVKQFSGRIIHLDKGRVIHSGHACFI